MDGKNGSRGVPLNVLLKQKQENPTTSEIKRAEFNRIKGNLRTLLVLIADEAKKMKREKKDSPTDSSYWLGVEAQSVSMLSGLDDAMNGI